MSDVQPPSAPRPTPSARRRPRHAAPVPKRRLAVRGVAILVVLAVVAVAGVFGYGWYRYNQIHREDLNLSATSGKVQNILIVGSDSRAVVSKGDSDAAAFLNAPGADSAGQRSDTIMVARVDPDAGTVDLLSFPRDLWIPIAPTGESERINTAFGAGSTPQEGADTIKDNVGISINHYVEINFKSFKGIVDAVDGVPMYFGQAVRDTNSGLYQYELGCVTLHGDEGIAYARSRHLEYLSSRNQWVDDPSGDLGRINRQTFFMRTVLDRAQHKFGSFDVRAINDILASTADNLVLDKGFGINELVSLAKKFKGFSGDQIRSHALPVYPDMTSGGASILRLDALAAEDDLNVFRGLPPGTVVPRSVTLGVSSASGVSGRSADVISQLDKLSYHVSAAGDLSKTQARTSVHYAPGSAAHADLVARQLAGGAELQVDTSLAKSKTPVVLVIGQDYTAVLDKPSAPTTTTTTAPPPTTAGRNSTTTTSTTIPLHTGEVTELVGVLAGKPPEGTVCR